MSSGSSEDSLEKINSTLKEQGMLTEDLVCEVHQLIASIVVEETCFEEVAEPQISPVVTDPSPPQMPPTLTTSASDQGTDDIRQIISKATLPQKIKLGLLGNATCRGLLIRDSNRMIQQCVLKNPRLQPTEVEDFAKNPNLSELVLRTIASNSQWMRSYATKVNLIFNPKTPQDVAIKWVKFLLTPDLRKLAKSKNVSNVISVTARKRLAESEK